MLPISLILDLNSNKCDMCMEIKKHLLINMNLAFTLSNVRPLAALALFLFVPSLPAQAFPTQETTTPKTFADWCLNQHNLSKETLRTIHAMLTVAQTKDCAQADELLSKRTELSLSGNSIADLKPLSTLTQLTSLDLSGNSIADLKPLSTLTQLTSLYLDNNSIADLKPLSTLTQLTSLDLSENQMLTDKSCPVQPESICRF